jgi:hypothetical protein
LSWNDNRQGNLTSKWTWETATLIFNLWISVPTRFCYMLSLSNYMNKYYTMIFKDPKYMILIFTSFSYNSFWYKLFKSKKVKRLQSKVPFKIKIYFCQWIIWFSWINSTIIIYLTGLLYQNLNMSNKNGPIIEEGDKAYKYSFKLQFMKLVTSIPFVC